MYIYLKFIRTACLYIANMNTINLKSSKESTRHMMLWFMTFCRTGDDYSYTYKKNHSAMYIYLNIKMCLSNTCSPNMSQAQVRTINLARYLRICVSRSPIWKRYYTAKLSTSINRVFANTATYREIRTLCIRISNGLLGISAAAI